MNILVPLAYFLLSAVTMIFPMAGLARFFLVLDEFLQLTLGSLHALSVNILGQTNLPFLRIHDDLEIDFQRTIASMPGSEGMSSASLKSYSNDNHSLVEITINNGINMCSFDSENHTGEEDSLVSEVVVRKTKDCLARVESVDEEDDCRSDVDTVSQCESETMSILMNRLAITVGELREL